MALRRAVLGLLAATWVVLAASGQVQGHPDLEVAAAAAGPTATCTPGWGIVSSPNAGTLDNYLQAVATISSSDAWTVGYTGPRGSRQTLIEHWNGSNWSVVPSPNGGGTDNYLQAVTAVSAGDVWAVGNTGDRALVLHWDGSIWSVVPAAGGIAGGNYLSGVAAVSSNDVWASGYYEDGVTFQTLVERWDGSKWSVVQSPNVSSANNELLAMAAVSAGDAWAVGNYAKGTVLQTLTEHWDGTRWSIVPSPNTGPWASFTGVAVISAGDAWAVGAHAEENPFRTLMEHWDGAGWSIMPGPDVGEGAILSAVSAISTDDVWTVGSSLQTGSVVIEHWDGKQWGVSPGANNNGSNSLSGVATLPNGDIWATGGYEDDSLLERTLAERYTGPCATPTATVTPTPTATPTVARTATRTATPCAAAFSDVHTDDYFYEPVRNLYCRNVISGYRDNTFRPYNLTTRGQVAKLVVLAKGWAGYTPPTPTFSDVPATDTFYLYIEIAYHQGIISGYNCGTGCLEFRPGNNVTRGELCKIIVLTEGWTLYTPPSPTFRDVPAGDAFYAHVETAYHHGIISGYDCGASCLEFRTGNNATRGQVSKILYNAITSP